jgi:hypothetical protein
VSSNFSRLWTVGSVLNAISVVDQLFLRRKSTQGGMSSASAQPEESCDFDACGQAGVGMLEAYH